MSDELNSTNLANWTLADIDFTADCETAAKFASDFIVYWDDASYKSIRLKKESFTGTESEFAISDQFPYGAFINAVRSVAPDQFLNLSVATILSWVDGLNVSSFETVQTLGFITRNCRGEFCQSQEWEGNPDLAGIGVMASYITQVVLTTIFIASFLPVRISESTFWESYNMRHCGIWWLVQKVHSSLQRKLPGKIHKGLKASFGVYWDSAFLFSFAIVISAIASDFAQPSIYHRRVSITSIALSFSCTTATWPLYRRNGRRPRHRWYLLFMLFIGVQAPVIFLLIHRTRHAKRPTVFEAICLGFDEGWFRDETHRLLANSVTILSMGMFGFWEIATSPVILGMKNHLVHTPSMRLSRRSLEGIWHVFFSALMYYSLVDYIQLRNKASARAGDSFAGNDWGFGQVMALSTWVPTVLDFGLVFRGDLKALVCRLPLGVKIQLASEDEDGSRRRREDDSQTEMADLDTAKETGEVGHGERIGLRRWNSF